MSEYYFNNFLNFYSKNMIKQTLNENNYTGSSNLEEYLHMFLNNIIDKHKHENSDEFMFGEKKIKDITQELYEEINEQENKLIESSLKDIFRIYYKNEEEKQAAQAAQAAQESEPEPDPTAQAAPEEPEASDPRAQAAQESEPAPESTLVSEVLSKIKAIVQPAPVSTTTQVSTPTPAPAPSPALAPALAPAQVQVKSTVEQNNNNNNQKITAAGPNLAEDPQYGRYVKMLKMHVPRMAVEMKMTAEGLDPSLIQSYVV